MTIYFIPLKEERSSRSFNAMETCALFFTSKQQENFDWLLKFLPLLSASVATCISTPILGLKIRQNAINKLASENFRK